VRQRSIYAERRYSDKLYRLSALLGVFALLATLFLPSSALLTLNIQYFLRNTRWKILIYEHLYFDKSFFCFIPPKRSTLNVAPKV
jgi:hypothetical protein